MKSVNKNLRVLLLLLSFLCCFSCKKDKGYLYFREIKATAVMSTGQVIYFNINQPPQANLGISGYLSVPFVSVTNEANAQIYMSVADTSGIGGPNQPGTFPYGRYGYECHFIPNTLATPTRDFSSLEAAGPGSITFTRLESNYMEGNFSAVCRSGADSVTVSGTFKGEF